jgi:hypothetical protein
MNPNSRQRRLNFTGRQKILREHCLVSLTANEGSLLLAGEMRFDDLDLNPEATVHMEAYDQYVFHRFSLGSVEEVAKFEERLDGFDTASISKVKLDIRVVDKTNGLILARNSELRPKAITPGETVSILHVRASDELGQRVWKLDISGDEPVVLINRRVWEGDWSGFSRSNNFGALVLPEIFRNIVQWELEQNRDEGDWSPWAEFLKNLNHDPEKAPPTAGSIERESWIEEAVSKFAYKQKYLDLVLKGGS